MDILVDETSSMSSMTELILEKTSPNEFSARFSFSWALLWKENIPPNEMSDTTLVDCKSYV